MSFGRSRSRRKSKLRATRLSTSALWVPPAQRSRSARLTVTACRVRWPDWATLTSHSQLSPLLSTWTLTIALRAQQPARSLGHRRVNELSIRGPGRGASRRFEGGENPLRPGLLFRGGREDLVDDRQLARVKGGLAEETQPPGGLSLLPETRIVFEERMNPIAGRWLAGGAGREHEVRAGEKRFLLAGRDAEIHREIQASVGQQSTGRRGGDVERREDATRRFDGAVERHLGGTLRHPRDLRC